MAYISYAGLLLLNFMIILLALENTVANVHEGNILSKKWLMGEDDALHKAVFDGTVEVISAQKPLNSGRKLLQGAVNKRSSDTSADNAKDHKEREDSMAFLDEADEVANLMSRDYGGKDKPKRKPPINNHEPTD